MFAQFLEKNSGPEFVNIPLAEGSEIKEGRLYQPVSSADGKSAALVEVKQGK